MKLLFSNTHASSVWATTFDNFWQWVFHTIVDEMSKQTSWCEDIVFPIFAIIKFKRHELTVNQTKSILNWCWYLHRTSIIYQFCTFTEFCSEHSFIVQVLTNVGNSKSSRRSTPTFNDDSVREWALMKQKCNFTFSLFTMHLIALNLSVMGMWSPECWPVNWNSLNTSSQLRKFRMSSIISFFIILRNFQTFYRRDECQGISNIVFCLMIKILQK